MRQTLLALTFLAFIGANNLRQASAQDQTNWGALHQKDLRTWASKSGLSFIVIEKILSAIGRGNVINESGELEAHSIPRIKARSLADRGQVFIALKRPRDRARARSLRGSRNISL
jgi:hypothetical protein